MLFPVMHKTLILQAQKHVHCEPKQPPIPSAFCTCGSPSKVLFEHNILASSHEWTIYLQIMSDPQTFCERIIAYSHTSHSLNENPLNK